MKLKQIVLFALVITITVVAGWGIATRAYSPHQEDNPVDSPTKTSADISIEEQAGDTFRIILGATAIVFVIALGVGLNYKCWGMRGDKGAG